MTPQERAEKIIMGLYMVTGYTASLKLMTEAITEAEQAARLTERDRCISAACSPCGDRQPLLYDDQSGYYHEFSNGNLIAHCGANGIHSRLKKEGQEKN